MLTQNVDDLHVRAGTRSLVRIHGSIWELSCWDQCARGATPWRDESVPFATLPPRCPALRRAGAPRRRLVWRIAARRRPARRPRATACDVFLTVGTSAVVYPAAGLVHEARGGGAFTVEINPKRRRRRQRGCRNPWSRRSRSATCGQPNEGALTLH